MKRILLILCGLFAVSSSALGQDKEAESLFRDMEKGIRSAKGFQITFAHELGKRKVKGDMLLLRDHKARIRVSGNVEGDRKGAFEIVSDGKSLRSKGARLSIMPSGLPSLETGGKSAWDTPKHFHDGVCNTLIRGGSWYMVFCLPYLCGSDELGAASPDAEESKMRVYGFKMDGAEKVGEAEAKVVRYRFGSGGSRDDAEVAVWIDVKTRLPLKRTFVLRDGIQTQERYETFTLDPKIEGDPFGLPK